MNKTAEHPSGLTISFDDNLHRYTDDNGKTYYSVTKIIHSQFPKFDAERIAGFVARKRGCTREEVLNEWETKRRASTEFGDKIHSYAENLLLEQEWNYNKYDKNIPLYADKEDAYMKQLDFLIPKLKSFYELLGTEYVVFSPEFGLSGTIDLLMRNKRTGALCVFDWKTNEEIRDRNKHKNEQSGLNGFSHIPDANFHHYSIQLSTYLKMVHDEKYFDFDDFELALFHIRESEIIPYKVPYMEKEAQIILNLAKNPPEELRREYESNVEDND